MPMRLLLFVLLCFCFCTNVSYAQIRRPNTQSSPASTQPLRDSIPHEIDLTPDTFDFTYFYPHNMDREYPYRDTTIEGFQNFDPTRQQQWDYGSTGNLGSAHIPFVYQARQRSGFDIGFHQFDLYKTPYEKFAYYRIKKAFTGLHFTQGKTQQDTYTQALFARNFSEGIQLSLDFKRINHRGHYQNQKAENTSFLIGLWYHSLGQNYHAFCTFVSNTVYQQENGGIDIANLNNTNTGSASTVPVRLSSNTANTAHTERAIHFHHRLLLQKRKKNKRVAPPPPPLHRDSIFPERDSLLTGDALHNAQVHSSDTLTIRSDSTSSSIPDDSLAANDTQDTPVKKKRNFALLHHAMFQVSKYKFSETTPDSSFYSYFQVDNRGLRYFIRDRKIENTFTLNTSKVIHQEDTDTKKQKDFFEVGIRHSLHFVRQEPLDTIL
ncbi:MAG TPA: hypothetical protein ENJ45_04725, partial [Phaeodactylibacter sp.]|nr:hypothetical protein [Phaeodactylibacter sp.]